MTAWNKERFAVSVLMVMVFCLMLAFIGCPGIQQNPSTPLAPAAKYYMALKTFNVNVETYLQVYKLSDAATQAKWKASIDPLIKLAGDALDAWKASINAPTSSDKEKIWNAARVNFMGALVSNGIIKIE